MDNEEYREHHHRRVTDCPAGTGGCEDMKENTRLTKETHDKVVRIDDALLGKMDSDRTGWIPRLAQMEDTVKKAKSMTLTACLGLVGTVAGILWALLSGELTIRHP